MLKTITLVILHVYAVRTMLLVPPYFIRTLRGITAYEKLVPAFFSVAYPNVTGIEHLKNCFPRSASMAPFLCAMGGHYPWAPKQEIEEPELLPDEKPIDEHTWLEQLVFTANKPVAETSVRALDVFPQTVMFFGACNVKHSELNEVTRIMENLLRMCQTELLDITIVNRIVLQSVIESLNRTLNENGFKTVLSRRMAGRYYNNKLVKCEIGPRSAIIQVSIPIVSMDVREIRVRQMLPVPFSWERTICAVDKKTLTYAVLTYIDKGQKQYKFIICNPQINKLCEYSETPEDMGLSTKCASRVINGGTVTEFREDCPFKCEADTFPRLLPLGRHDAIYSRLPENQRIYCPNGDTILSPRVKSIGAIYTTVPCQCSLVNISMKANYPCQIDLRIRPSLLQIVPIQWAKLTTTLSLRPYEHYDDYPRFDSQEENILDVNWIKQPTEVDKVKSDTAVYSILGLIVIMNVCLMIMKLRECVLNSHLCPCSRAPTESRRRRHQTIPPPDINLTMPRTATLGRQTRPAIAPIEEYMEVQDPREIQLADLRPTALPLPARNRPTPGMQVPRRA